MNYICQMNGFWRWCRDHELPASPRLLWYALTAEQNYRRWAEEFELSSTSLCGLMGGVSINTFRRARDTLVREGLVKVKMATHGNEVSRYRMTQLYQEKKPRPTERPADRSKEGSTDGSADRSTDGSDAEPGLSVRPAEDPVKPQTRNPKDKTTQRREERDGTSIGSGLAKPAGQVSAVCPGSAGRGSSRRGVDWEREQGRGL